MRRCHSAERHDAIQREHGGAFSPEKLIVVLGAHAAWAPFLASRVFPGQRLIELKTVRDAGGRFVGRLFGDEEAGLRYCYFQMFRRPPPSNTDIVAFAEEVRTWAAHLLP